MIPTPDPSRDRRCGVRRLVDHVDKVARLYVMAILTWWLFDAMKAHFGRPITYGFCFCVIVLCLIALAEAEDEADDALPRWGAT